MKAWLITNEFLNGNKYSEINQWLVEAAKKKNITLEIKTNAEILVDMITRAGTHATIDANATVDTKTTIDTNITIDTNNTIDANITIDTNSTIDANTTIDTNIMVDANTSVAYENDIDFILFWDKDIRLAAYLEQSGYPVFNSSEAIAICDDKSLTHMCLHKAGMPMPRTILAPMTYANIGYNNLDFLKRVVAQLGFPMVVKECFGSFGMQVYLAHNEEELIEIINKIGGKPFLFQEYIECSSGKDIRIHVVGDQVITSMYRYSENGDFRANITNGGNMKPYEPSEEEKSLAIQCCKAIGLDFAGIDLLFGPDGTPLVCEVNSNAHFKNIFDCTGVNVADYIMDYIAQNLQL